MHLFHKLRIGRSRSSKVIDFGTNRKRVCDLLLVRHNKLDLYLVPFHRYCRFSAPHPIPP